jgi:hypothetical protein
VEDYAIRPLRFGGVVVIGGLSYEKFHRSVRKSVFFRDRHERKDCSHYGCDFYGIGVGGVRLLPGVLF